MFSFCGDDAFIVAGRAVCKGAISTQAFDFNNRQQLCDCALYGRCVRLISVVRQGYTLPPNLE